MNSCECYFCVTGKEHKHSLEITWHPISSRLKVAESLDPNDIVKRWACNMCGHVKEES